MTAMDVAASFNAQADGRRPATPTRREQENPMGVVNANVVISNPAAPRQSWEGRFLVDKHYDRR